LVSDLLRAKRMTAGYVFDWPNSCHHVTTSCISEYWGMDHFKCNAVFAVY
jgi:hypothetical protein